MRHFHEIAVITSNMTETDTFHNGMFVKPGKKRVNASSIQAESINEIIPLQKKRFTIFSRQNTRLCCFRKGVGVK